MQASAEFHRSLQRFSYERTEQEHASSMNVKLKFASGDQQQLPEMIT
jgi:hypothetical protein